jgi:hypothetical protein
MDIHIRPLTHVTGGQDEAIGRDDYAAAAAETNFDRYDGRRHFRGERLDMILDVLEVFG